MTRDYPERPIVGVGAVVLRGNTVLLIRRAKPPRVGQWSLPGGMQELGETLENAVRREVREETGLELETLELLTTVDLIEADDDRRIRYHYSLVDYVAEAAEGEPVAEHDATAARFVPLDEIGGLGMWEETQRIIALAVARRPHS